MEHSKNLKKITTKISKKNNLFFLISSGVFLLVMISVLYSYFTYFFLNYTTDTLKKESIISIFMLIIGSPFLEETLFRGILLNFLLKKIQNPLYATIIVAVLFTVAHIEIYYYLPCFFASLVLSNIYIKSNGNLKISLLTHCLANTLLFLLSI